MNLLDQTSGHHEPLTKQELDTALSLRIAQALKDETGDLRALVSLAIRNAEPIWDQDLCVGEAMEGTDWLSEDDIQKLCDAAADVAIAVIGQDTLAVRTELETTRRILSAADPVALAAARDGYD